MRDLILSDSFEELKEELGNNLNKMMDFVIPISEAENNIAIILGSMRNSGKLVILEGRRGTGKSTFVHSLKWRPHLAIREVITIDASNFSSLGSKLNQLIEVIREVCNSQKFNNSSGKIPLIIIDYLETISNENEHDKKAFFRDLSGILRNNKVLIVWPMTEEEEVQDVLVYSDKVSGTIFHRKMAVIKFSGPNQEEFPNIVKNTIGVLNTGYTYTDFQFVDEDFNELGKILLEEDRDYVLRDYIQSVIERWETNVGRIHELLKSIPKPTEIYFLFAMPEAEVLVNQFTRISATHADCWDVQHSRLNNYTKGNQREAIWNSERLQLALSGAFKTKMFFMPTNAIVSAIVAYSLDDVDDIINKLPQASWQNRSTANRFLKSSPLIKYLTEVENHKVNTVRGPAQNSVEKAREAFVEINKIVSKYNIMRNGSDKPFNKSIADALKKVLNDENEFNIKSEVFHPWLTSIRPDIMVEKSDKIICIEICYTAKDVPSAVSDYVLKKLDTYMRQLEGLYPNIYK